MTTVSIHQPNYLPWLGYFDKIRNSDIFVFLDNVKYTRGGFINRNKIKSPNGVIWLTVPISRPYGLIKDALISYQWRPRDHWLTLKFCYERAPNFKKYYYLFQEVYKKKWTHISNLNKHLIKIISNMFNLKTEFVNASSLNINGTGTELLVNICKKLGAKEYLSGDTRLSAKNKYFQEDKFIDKCIKIRYQGFIYPKYKQIFGKFIPNLSVIDYLFNVGNKYW